MLFFASELWPLAAATAWIALAVWMVEFAVAGGKRRGSRAENLPRSARRSVVRVRRTWLACPTAIALHPTVSVGVGKGVSARVISAMPPPTRGVTAPFQGRSA